MAARRRRRQHGGALRERGRAARVRTAAPEPVHQPWAEVERDELPPRVVAGTCDLSLLPASMVEEPAEDDAAALRVMLNEWLGAPHAEFRRGPGIEHRRGIVHVESEEDRGDDPPYPRSAEPEAQRVCGSAAAWLRTHLRERLQFEGLACQGNVCCFDGMEYHPAGLVVFRRGAVVDGPDWMIEGWIEVHVAALAPE
ncbi:MAG: hypothetical protein K8M05_35635, partial [Deltaproteobacteria bacterium]|nr:hypothetical protein [Kofleriaceae bacterium]